MRYIPTFILEHWIHKSKIYEGELFVVNGKFYGKKLQKGDKEIDIYEFDLKNEKWIKMSKERKVL